MTEKKTPPKRALVMIVEGEDGTISLIDANEKIHEVKDANGLMTCAKSIVSGTDMPSIKSSPTSGPTAAERESEEKLTKAFGTLGNRLREVAEAEYGQDVVGAASTVLAASAKKTTGLLRRLSRGKRSGSGRYALRRRSS